MRMLARIGLLLMLAGTWAFGGDHFLIRVPAHKIGKIAARHRLTVVRSLEGSAKNLFVVRPGAGSQSWWLQFDDEVEAAEVDEGLPLPELRPSSSLRATMNLGLGRPTAIPFYGTQALGSYVNQPAIYTVQLPGARMFATGAGTVAILDTGVDPKHPVLKNSLVAGYDFTRDASGGSEMPDLSQSTTAILDDMQSTTAILDKDDLLIMNQSTTAILDQSTTAILDQSRPPAAFGHGTMVAGIVHLVAPTAKIMPVKVFDKNGVGNMSDIVAGIYWAVDHGADVINMSFSTEHKSIELKKAIDYAVRKGVVCIASAGNSGEDVKVYPANYGIGVGSTNNHMMRSQFSNYGDVVDLAAPGEGVITLYPGANYAAAWGTSFSAPFVAGGAALLVQLERHLNPSQAAQALKHATPIYQGLGAGELDLFGACLYQILH